MAPSVFPHRQAPGQANKGAVLGFIRLSKLARRLAAESGRPVTGAPRGHCPFWEGRNRRLTPVR